MQSTIISDIGAAADRVRTAIASASRRTGMDFGYLYKQAKVESGLNSNAKAKTSSATGLYQFLDQSWLGAVKRHGAKHGMDWAAGCITKDGAGRLCVRDPSMRAAVMELRKQPEASALMAAETASDNKSVIENGTGRAANATDLYMGHFLGPKGAVDFLRHMAANPNQRADQVAPAAAGSNRGVFYNADGSARTLAEVYDRFSNKLGGDSAPLPSAANTQIAEVRADLPNLPLALARALSGETGDSVGLDDIMAQAKPDTARLAYLMLASLSA